MSFDHNQDAPEVLTLSERRVKARKDHVCRSCNEVIPAGTTHVVHVYLFEGAFKSDRTHGFGYPTCPRDIAAEQQFAAEDRAEQQRVFGLSRHGEWR